MTTDAWTDLKTLEGKTLHTVARHKLFTVGKFTDATVELVILDGGKSRMLRVTDLELF